MAAPAIFAFQSLDDAIRYWESLYGPQVRGATSPEDFVGRLQGKRDGRPVSGWRIYNSVNPNWRSGAMNNIRTVQRRLPVWRKVDEDYSSLRDADGICRRRRGSWRDPYRNVNYAFTFENPATVAACPHEPPAPSHGAIFPLSGRNCANPLAAEYISVDGSYNVADHIDTKAATLAGCEGRSSRPSPINPRIRFRHCDVQRQAGWQLHQYVALRLLPEPDWPTYGIVYTAYLHCRPANCARYLPVFRRVVASIRYIRY